MVDRNSDRKKLLRIAIEQFLHERRDTKREKLSVDDPKYETLTAQFTRETWLEDAARRVSQIQAVTHTLKAIHPDARGTNLYRAPSDLPQHQLIGSHALGADFSTDVVGNAAALDVYKFLKIEFEQRPLLDWMLDGDQDIKSALSDDQQKAAAWMEAFTGLVRPRGDPASHTRAKQIYWLVGEDPGLDEHYNLLAPLYPSSLAHRVHNSINETRFGEEAKDARTARREGRDHPTGYAEYPDLAIQKMGGTKPQNISQLNSERGGNNYLLGSLPPTWKTRTIRNPWYVDSVLPHFGRRPMVRDVITRLRKFLESDPPPNNATRARRDELTDTLIDELVFFAGELHEHLPEGWSADTNCQLVESERLWLDPGRAESDSEFRTRWLTLDWPREIGQRFGNWLNGQLDGQLPVGDIELRHWRTELLCDRTWVATLNRVRRQVDAHQPSPVEGEA